MRGWLLVECRDFSVRLPRIVVMQRILKFCLFYMVLPLQMISEVLRNISFSFLKQLTRLKFTLFCCLRYSWLKKNDACTEDLVISR